MEEERKVFRRLGEQDEELALLFRNTLTTQEAVVKALYDSRDSPDFITRARNIIASRSRGVTKDEGKEVAKLKRICWCWFRNAERSNLYPLMSQKVFRDTKQ